MGGLLGKLFPWTEMVPARRAPQLRWPRYHDESVDIESGSAGYSQITHEIYGRPTAMPQREAQEEMA
jgi:hypothetical protein